jgi:hypothetical protein
VEKFPQSAIKRNVWASKLSVILKNCKLYHRELDSTASARPLKETEQQLRVKKYRLLKRNNDKIAVNLENIIAHSLRARFYSTDIEQSETFGHKIFDNV